MLFSCRPNQSLELQLPSPGDGTYHAERGRLVCPLPKPRSMTMQEAGPICLPRQLLDQLLGNPELLPFELIAGPRISTIRCHAYLEPFSVDRGRGAVYAATLGIALSVGTFSEMRYLGSDYPHSRIRAWQVNKGGAEHVIDIDPAACRLIVHLRPLDGGLPLEPPDWFQRLQAKTERVPEALIFD